MFTHKKHETSELYVKPQFRGRRLLKSIASGHLNFFTRMGVEEGSYAWMLMGGHRVLFLNDATGIEYVFRADNTIYHKGKYNEHVRPLLGQSVFLSEEELWRQQRRDTAPVFAGGNFSDFVTQINAAIEAMLVRWDAHAESGEPIDVKQEMMWLTLDVVFRSLYHEESNETQIQMSKALGTMLTLAESRIWRPINVPMKLMLKLPKYAKTMAFLESITAELIEARKRNRTYPADLLSRLIESHDESPKQKKLLRDNVLSFLLAGHETTANATAWMFWELGRNTYVRQRLVSEIDREVGIEAPTFETAKKLKYCLQVFHETMRLYPPVWTMSREVTRADVIPLDSGQTLAVPANTTIMLCCYSVHRREAYWNDPEAFNPDRFERDHSVQRPRNAWFPFGGGQRLCMGFRLAEMEALSALVRVYQRYELALVPGQDIQPEPIITLRPDRPILYRLKRREREKDSKQFTAIVELSSDAAQNGECPFHGARVA